MTHTIQTRNATEADIPQLCTLYWHFHNHHVQNFPDRLRLPVDTVQLQMETEKIQAALKKIIVSKDGVIFIVEDSGNLIGFVEAYLRQDEEQPVTIAKRYVYVQSLFVDPEYRKRGLGEKLMASIHQWGKEQGATEIQLETWEFAAGPLLFYEKLGYQTIRRYMVTKLDELASNTI